MISLCGFVSHTSIEFVQVKQDVFEVPPEGMMVTDLADVLAVGVADVVKALFYKGITAQANQHLDQESAMLAAAAFGSVGVAEDEQKVLYPSLTCVLPCRCQLRLTGACACHEQVLCGCQRASVDAPCPLMLAWSAQLHYVLCSQPQVYQYIRLSTARVVALQVEDLAKNKLEFDNEDDKERMSDRPPVVVVMGHVDHGKTVRSCDPYGHCAAPGLRLAQFTGRVVVSAHSVVTTCSALTCLMCAFINNHVARFAPGWFSTTNSITKCRLCV